MTNKLVKNNTKLNQKRGGGVRSPQTTFKFALGGVANPETEKRLTMVQSIFTHVASINANLLEQKKKRLHKDLFGIPAWPPFHCFGTPIWSP